MDLAYSRAVAIAVTVTVTITITINITIAIKASVAVIVPVGRREDGDRVEGARRDHLAMRERRGKHWEERLLFSSGGDGKRRANSEDVAKIPIDLRIEGDE